MDFAYELPIGRGRALGRDWNRALDMLAGGWQINGILTFQSGSPLVPNLTAGILPGATQRPNLLFEPDLPGSVTDRLNGYLNPNAFSRPAAYTFGNAPRTLSRVRGPGFRNADVSVFKNVYLNRERGLYFQIRGEAFNVTNTPHFLDPNVTVGATNFGVISQTARGGDAPRQLQIAMKFYF